MEIAVSQRKPFFGRERELSELTERFMKPGCQILTISGIGGIGKTTLALELTNKLQRHFKNGICFVPLADLEHSGQVAPAIASKLGIRISGGDIAKQLLDALIEKNILLVLDNFEHLIKASFLVEQIGLRAENVKLLVTSRSRLNIAGESVYELSGMKIPQKTTPEVLFSSAPVKLFLSNPEVDGRLDLNDLEVVVQICREASGVPLGIVLASSWLGRMSPSEILAEMSGKNKLLHKETSRRERRHSSLRRVFDYSWMLLSREERIIFAELSIFRGGFDAEAVEFITGGSGAVLRSLHEKSLLQTESSGRFSMHPLLHDFSSAKLDLQLNRRDVLLARHAEYYCRLLEKNDLAILGEDSTIAMEEIKENLSEVRTAVTNSITMGMSDAFIAGCKTLQDFYMRTGLLEEGWNLFKRASETLKEISPVSAFQIMQRQAVFGVELALYNKAAVLFESILAGGESEVIGTAAFSLGMVYMRTGNLKRAENRMSKALDFARISNDRELEAKSLGGLGDLFNHKLEVDKARYFMMQAVEINREAGNIRALFSNWITLSNIMANDNRGDQALEYAHFALECAETLQGELYLALSHISIAEALEVKEKFNEALEYATDAVHTFEELNSRWGVQSSCRTKASLESSLGKVEESITSINKAIKLSEEIGGTYNSMEAFITGGEIYEIAGEKEKSITLYAKARKIARHLNIEEHLKKLDKKLNKLDN